MVQSIFAIDTKIIWLGKVHRKLKNEAKEYVNRMKYEDDAPDPGTCC